MRGRSNNPLDPTANPDYPFNALNEGSALLGVRLDTELEERLANVARSQGRSKSDIARDAVRRYVELHDEAFRAEARRQSERAAARDDGADWAFFDRVEAEDGRWR
ncbi:ribbon-helix-helix protein, CopG family [Sphingomonas hankookensis]|uniref:ribbon-helix-helix protein, CopG family n=1 Tax=Sphingomonas hankookensis TaxID=563996 RepID=UPI003D3035EE